MQCYQANRFHVVICAYLFIGALICQFITPLYAMTSFIPVPGDVMAIARFKSVFESIEAAFHDNNNNDLFHHMMTLKKDAEWYLNGKFDVDKIFKDIEKECASNGCKIDKKYLNAMKNRLKIAEKAQKKAEYSEYCDNLLIDVDEDSFDLWLDPGEIDCKKKKDNKQEDQEQVEVPITLQVGITMTLSGVFLYSIPLPFCKMAGKKLLDIGLTTIFSYGVNEIQDRQKEKDENNDE